MATLSTRTVVSTEPSGVCTVDLLYDPLTFLVASVLVGNGFDHDYTFTFQNTLNPPQTITQTVVAGAINVSISLATLAMSLDSLLTLLAMMLGPGIL